MRTYNVTILFGVCVAITGAVLFERYFMNFGSTLIPSETGIYFLAVGLIAVFVGLYGRSRVKTIASSQLSSQTEPATQFSFVRVGVTVSLIVLLVAIAFAFILLYYFSTVRCDGCIM